MSGASHPTERLLELAYGELSQGDAARVEEHVQGCPQCSDELSAIRSVRRAMAPLSDTAAPDAGLDSLLAYAGRAAERSREPQARTARYGVWALSLLGSVGLALVLLMRVSSSLELAPTRGLASAAREPAPSTANGSAERSPPAFTAPPAAAAPLVALAEPKAAPEGSFSRHRERVRPTQSARGGTRRKPDDEMEAEPGAVADEAAERAKADVAPEAAGEEAVATTEGDMPARAAPAPAAKPSPAPELAEAPALPAPTWSQPPRATASKKAGKRAYAEPPPAAAPPVGLLGAAESAGAARAGVAPSFQADADPTDAEARALEEKARGSSGAEREQALVQLCFLTRPPTLSPRSANACRVLLREFPGSRAAPDAQVQLQAASAPTSP